MTAPTRRAVLALLFLGVPALAHGKSQRETLFRIARSKNKNVVVYDARLRADGSLDHEKPLDVYWRLLAEDGRREELSSLEWAMAYGYSVRDVERGRVTVVLHAVERPIVLEKPANERARAMTRINGANASLERLYVRANDGALFPSVEYVDLFGSRDGTDVQERIRP